MSRSADRAPGWWRTKVRQFRTHLFARVRPTERAALTTWLTTPQLVAFDAMPTADRRHGLDVVALLLGDGVADADILIAGLLHDAGKGRSVRLWHRVAWSLGEAWGSRVIGVVARLPGFRAPLERISDHAELSARIAAAAGCSERTVDLIRHGDAARDSDAGRSLKRADEAA